MTLTCEGLESRAWRESNLAAALAHQLGLPSQEIGARQNLLRLGLDSLDILEWAHRFQAAGHAIVVADLYRKPTLEGWMDLVRADAAESAPEDTLGDAPPDVARNDARRWPTTRPGQPFRLTPVQHAYLVGRSNSQSLGGVGCHLYQEFDGAGLTPQDLEAAVLAVLERHPMLRAAFRPDGTQVLGERPVWSGLTVHDLRLLSEEARERALADLRERLSHRLLDVEGGESMDVQMAVMPDGRYRVFTNVDLLVADAAGYATIFEDIGAVLRGDALPKLSEEYDFRSYLAQREALEKDRRARDQAFWHDRLKTLPDAPALPLQREPETIDRVRITRRSVDIGPEAWDRFQAQARTHGLTPTMVLATCFGAVLGRWTGQSRLLLNLTLFDRQPLHPSVEGMVADFTNVMVLDLDCAPGALCARAQANQATFADAWSHSAYSGVEVMRDLRKHGRHPHGAPVVFTGNLNTPLIGRRVEETLGKAGWGVSQTPQVWIDHMAVRRGDTVVLQWDCNEDLFPDEMISAMFAAYVALVDRLTTHADAWADPALDVLPADHLAARVRANATAAPMPNGCLHDAVFGQAADDPDEIAVYDGSLTWTRGDLAARAGGLSDRLQDLGVSAGDRVGICMPKGAGQVAAALGILHAGATYVPVGVDQPAERINRICDDAGLAAVIVCAEDPAHAHHGDGLDRVVWQTVPPADPGPGASVCPDQAAYVIYTSGSTGMPKGVVVSHRSALNTCVDLNARYGVGRGDRVLALSALHFDLSVYDIFGVLGAGGGIVLVAEGDRRDPAVWCDRIERDGVTLWNTVPALFDMLLTFAEGCDLPAPERLRLVFLSGDWIGKDLPARYRAFRRDGQFVAMGGATEAAIWSNALDVDDVPEHWPSIPYGFPLANQSYRVVDAVGRDCPAWTPGELWIGGVGVALGYFNDPERTADRFVETATGRWYRTGDLGRYWPDGMLEFLGRRDKQVKVGGHRIELGEIDAAFSRIAGIAGAVTLATGDKEKKLCAFATLKPGAFRRRLTAESGMPSTYRTWFETLPATSVDPRRARVIAQFLVDHLSRYGVDLTEPRSAEAIAGVYGCARAARPLLDDWLRLLGAQGLLAEREGFYSLTTPAIEVARADVESTPEPLQQALERHHGPLVAMLRDETPALSLLDDPVWSPEQVALRLPGMTDVLDHLAGLIRDLGPRLGRPVRVVEYGARGGVAAAALLERLTGADVSYLALDESPEMVRRARDRLAAWGDARAERCDDAKRSRHAHTADIVWANNALHRMADPVRALNDLWSLAAPGACVMVLEVSSPPAEGLVSTEVLRRFDRQSTEICDATVWRDRIATLDAVLEAHHDLSGLNIVLLRSPACREVADPEAIGDALSAHVPGYMIPRQIRVLDQMPLTANGKVDAKALAAMAEEAGETRATETPPRTAAETQVARLWQQLLECGPVSRESDFFKLGGDSLAATRLVGTLALEGWRARLETVFAHPTLSAFAATLQPLASPAGRSELVPDPSARFAPFPLTEVQQAYLVGRQPGFALSGVASHFCVVFETEALDVQRFRAAWERLIARHDMLRAVVEDGRQRVLEAAPDFDIPRHRFARLDGPRVRALEERLSQELRDPSVWPAFAVHVIEADDTPRCHILIDIDNLFIDGMSMQILFADLKALYQDLDAILSTPAMTFRDYLVHVEGTPPPQQALDHWRRRLASLPGAPDLPVIRPPQDVNHPRFVRREGHLPAETWAALRRAAQRHDMTPSALLLAVYAATISAFSARPEITLNLTVFDRQPVHPDVDQVLGDFTSLMLASWEPRRRWLDSARHMQTRLREDMAHRGVSAIRVMRDLARREGVAAVSMPVVFTSAIGYDQDEGFLSRRAWLKPAWGISQTPQTWIDLQVYEADGMLFYNWDAAEALFEPSLLNGMIDRFTAMLRRLGSDVATWDLDLEALCPREAAPVARPVPPPRETKGSGDALTIVHPTGRQERSSEETPLRLIVDFFRQDLGQEIIAQRNFFDAGATSLTLVRLHAFLRRKGYPSLETTDVFLHASPAALARHLGAMVPDGADEASPGATSPGATSTDVARPAMRGRLRRRRRSVDHASA